MGGWERTYHTQTLDRGVQLIVALFGNQGGDGRTHATGRGGFVQNREFVGAFEGGTDGVLEGGWVGWVKEKNE